jgi:pilus assembly protein CpaF
VSLQEIVGMEGNIISTQEIFTFKQQGVDDKGKVKGRFEISRIRPKFLEKFAAVGVPIPEDIFRSDKVFEV